MVLSSNLTPDVAGLNRLVSQDPYSAPTYGGWTDYERSRVHESERWINGPNNTTVLRRGWVIFELAPDAEAGDLVRLPSGDVRQVISVRYGRDGTGTRRYTRTDYS